MPDDGSSERSKLPRPFTPTTFRQRLAQFYSMVGELAKRKKAERDMEEKPSAPHEVLRFEQFGESIRNLFGRELKDQDLKSVFKKLSTQPEASLDWSELFGYYTSEHVLVDQEGDEEAPVFRVSKRVTIGNAAGELKRRDVAQSIVKILKSDFTIVATQKGTISIYNNKMMLQATTTLTDSFWVVGCDYLSHLKRVAVATENSIIVWDHKPKNKNRSNYFTIKPLHHSPLCVCTVTNSENQHQDEILLGDTGGFVSLFTLASEDFKTKHTKRRTFQTVNPSQFRVPVVKRKLHNDAVEKVKFFPELNRFGSCSLDSVHSLVLDDVRRLEDAQPVAEFSIPRGVNAFAFCSKATLIATGGCDKIIRVWHPNILTRPVGKLKGHLFTISDITVNEKDQHIISVSSARAFKVWDIQTLSLLQTFAESPEATGDTRIYSMIFDNKHNRLVTGSSIIVVWPLRDSMQDTMQVPSSHDGAINVLVYNRPLNQMLSVCCESVIKVWELETGFQTYQIFDAHGPLVEVTAAAIDATGHRLATGASDGSLKVWNFGSGQEIKSLSLMKKFRGEDPGLRQLVYFRMDSRRAILTLEWNGSIKIIQDLKNTSDLVIIREFPDLPSTMVHWNLNISKWLQCQEKDNKRSSHFHPLPQTSQFNCVNENFPAHMELVCFDILEWNQMYFFATGLANGLILLWDFAKATVKYLCKENWLSESIISKPQSAIPDSPRVHAIKFLSYTIRKADSNHLRKERRSPQLSYENVIDVITGESDVKMVSETSRENQPDVKQGNNTKLASDTEEEGEEGEESPESRTESSMSESLSEQSSATSFSIVLASAHQNGHVYFWSTEGILLKKLLPENQHHCVPLTAICTDNKATMLFAGDDEGHIIYWHIKAFMENTTLKNKESTRQVVCWKAHPLSIVSLFYVENKSIVVSGSVEGSIRIWYAPEGHYIGYFSQQRAWILSKPVEFTLPSDITEWPFVTKMKKKIEKKVYDCPLVFDIDKYVN
nr:PREDICTED: WD repeat-containing protein 64 [Latimeria chalumnae]|eukprot:XP_014344351.1 PREDICTED: WD repeat-containing protein 64 [Latimeria chalumnae]